LPHLEKCGANGHEKAEPDQKRQAGCDHACLFGGMELFVARGARLEQVEGSFDPEKRYRKLASQDQPQGGPSERWIIQIEENRIAIDLVV